MRIRFGFLHVLRKERRTLSTLAAVSVVARVLVGMFALTMAPTDALADEPTFIICSGQTGGAEPVQGSPWDAFHCPCGICHHVNCALACGLPGAAALLPMPAHGAPIRLARSAQDRPSTQDPLSHARIRAPPSHA